MDIKSLVNLLKKSAPPAAVLRKQYNEMPGLIAEAERAADELENKRRGVLLEDSDEALERIEQEIAAANRTVERLYAAQAELARRIEAADAEDVELQRRKRYDEAQREVAEAQKALRQYEAAARKVADIIRQLAEAEQAVNAANAALPEGAARLPSIEQSVRGLPGEPEQVVSTEALPPRWHYTGANAHRGAVDASLVGRIKSEDGRTGTLLEGQYEKRRHAVELRQDERRVEYLTARPAFTPVALAASVSLPGLQPSAHAIWEPCGSMIPGEDAEQVIAAADGLAEVAKRPHDPRGPRQRQSRIEQNEH